MRMHVQGDSGTLRLYLDGQFVTEETDLPPMRRNDAVIVYTRETYVSDKRGPCLGFRV